MLENLDELNPTTEKMKKAKLDLIALFEELNNELATSDTIQKTTYFNDMSKKIDTILRINFNPEL
jgi:cell division FtsZ-interacting protein ZapD